MIGEEIGINEFLGEHGIKPIETDLGEYIVQLRTNRRHIIAPAIHLTQKQVADAFREHHTSIPRRGTSGGPAGDAGRGARRCCGRKFLSAEVGITGANMLIAETGSIVLVTSEGNGDLTQTLPRVQIVIASIEKVVPTLEDSRRSSGCWRARPPGRTCPCIPPSTGPSDQAISTDPKRSILLDNGRRPCSATSSARCSTASAARRVHQPLSDLQRGRQTMPTAGSIQARWARS